MSLPLKTGHASAPPADAAAGKEQKQQPPQQGGQETPPGGGDVAYPTGIRRALIVLCIFTGMFLVTLDRLIVATAIPQITDDFDSAGDIGWYGTAYLLTSCAFQLLFGRAYRVFSTKGTFLTSIVLFEAGSVLCGAANSSTALICGRALAGLGSGGIMAGVIAILVVSVPLHRRPTYQGFFGGVFAVASVMGPLVGGAFTTNVTWRWCFYINLPVGGVVFVLTALLLHTPPPPPPSSTPAGGCCPGLVRSLQRLDMPGMLVLVPAIVCLCLALQWGGTRCSWGGGRVVALLVLAGVLLAAYVATQVGRPEQQVTVAPRILLQRSIAAGFLTAGCMGANLTLFSFYLPLWFQAVEGVSAATSGLRTLPMMMAIVAASISAGFLVSRIGYYTPFLVLGVALAMVGAGLLTTLPVGAAAAQWAGYQVVYGLGLGFAAQGPNMAAQTVLPKADIALGASLMFFAQQLFGAVFASVGQNVLANQLARRLAAAVPRAAADGRLTPQQIQQAGATDLLGRVPALAADRPAALAAYNGALHVVFRVGLIMASIALVGALAMEWRSVKKGKPAPPTAAEEGKAENV